MGRWSNHDQTQADDSEIRAEELRSRFAPQEQPAPAFTLAIYGHLLPRNRRGEVDCLDDGAPAGTPHHDHGFARKTESPATH